MKHNFPCDGLRLPCAIVTGDTTTTFATHDLLHKFEKCIDEHFL